MTICSGLSIHEEYSIMLIDHLAIGENEIISS